MCERTGRIRMGREDGMGHFRNGTGMGLKEGQEWTGA